MNQIPAGEPARRNDSPECANTHHRGSQTTEGVAIRLVLVA